MPTQYAQMTGRAKTAKSKSLTPQTRPLGGRESEMKKNNADGYSFKADSWSRLDRFLILGVTGNTMYQSQVSLASENAGLVEKLLAEDGLRVVHAATEVLRESRAMKVDAPFFVLAMAASCDHDATRLAALNALSSTVRIPTHLFTFVEYVNQMRGWGRGLRRAVGSYYTNTDVSKLAMHAWKYKSRNGWSHRDVLRLAHAETDDPVRNQILNYMVNGSDAYLSDKDDSLRQIAAAEELLHTTDAKTAVNLILDYRLTREAVPTGLLNEVSIWEALLQHMPLTAMIRNLGKMSSLGMTKPLSATEKLIVSRLGNEDRVTGSRIHPMNVLVALKTYQKGSGVKGNLTWKANDKIVDGLQDAFELAFGNVEVTGKRILLAGDDSGSMNWGNDVMNVMKPSEAAAAMMYITHRVEPDTVMLGYSTSYREISTSKRMTIDSLLRQFGNGGGTNTALPVKYALDTNIDFDAIVSYTDNETWAGSRYFTRGNDGHVTELLRDYQNRVGHPVKFANIAMTANSVSDVDPQNSSMFEIAGMDSQTPQIISEFVAGRI